MTDMLARGEFLLDAATVGNKFARLESMRLAGFPVPRLFCLPAAAFDLAVAELALPAPPTDTDLDDVRSWSLAAAKAVTGLTVPRSVAERALAEFDDVIGPDGLAAVRACVVPAAGPAR
jgi:pyruvate,water dikinase